MNDLKEAIARVEAFTSKEVKRLSLLLDVGDKDHQNYLDAWLEFEEDVKAILSALKERGGLGEWRLVGQPENGEQYLIFTQGGVWNVGRYWRDYNLFAVYKVAGKSMIDPDELLAVFALPQPPREKGPTS